MSVTVTKTVEEGVVYARHTFEDGRTIVENTDPHITHNAPSIAAEGASLTISFSMLDFDGAPRYESGGVLLLDVDGTEVPLLIVDGTATLVIELFASARIRQQPPYFYDARLEPFHIEVTA
jgi:hypothetical protein